MTAENPDQLGRLDDDAEEREPSSTTTGAASEGDYDPAEGSPGHDAGNTGQAGPGHEHPTGEDFPAEATRYDEPKHRRAD
ncbi:MAG TPA: hypothetical protein VFM09_03710 [Marmoricola sp.]|nr:hypothetical protein [Marmoricola sp.]